MPGSFIEKSSSASNDSSALCYLCWQWHHLHTMCWQYFANATMWVAALSNIIPTLLAAAVFQHYWKQQQSLNWQQSEFPLLVTLLPPSHQSAHSSDHGLTRHRICSLDYGKEFKHDGNLFSNWLMSKNHCNVLMLLNDITIQMTRGMNEFNREANAVGKE